MKKWRKLLIAVLLVVCVISPVFTTASCEINTMYAPSDVDSEYLAEDMNDNWLLQLLSKFVFTVASWAENILGSLFALITGTVDFPWADKIIFNSVRVLDVNFISPAEGSYMEMAAQFIQDIYGTMFAIALSLFGVLVLITALKLAISSVASEKAKYKQALVSWVLGFVMLFTVHFLMAGLFYLNEQLVIEASNIANNAYDEANEVLTTQANDILNEAYDEMLEAGSFNNYIDGEIIDTTEIKALYGSYKNVYTYLYVETQSKGTYNYGLYGALAGYNNGDYKDEASNLEVIRTVTSIVDYLDRLDNKEAKWQATITQIDESLSKSFYAEPKGPIDNLLGKEKYFLLTKKTWGADDVLGQIIGKTQPEKHTTIGFAYSSTPIGLKLEKGKLYAKSPIDVKTLLSAWGEYVVGFLGSPLWSVVNVAKTFLSGDALINTDSGVADVVAKVVNSSGLAGTVIADKDKQLWFFDEFLKKDWDDDYYISTVNSTYKTNGELKEVALTCVLADIRDVIKTMQRDSVPVENRVSYINNLAKYFKTYAYSTSIGNTASIVKTEPSISNQIMYAILVVQSIMLFVSYLKRLFYVMLLSMMAPFVVVMDFFQKFGK